MEGPGSFVSLLRPVLDTYLDSAVGLVGCRSTGLARDSCEYDVLVIRQERLPQASIKIGREYVDLLFLTEEDAMRPRNPEVALSMAFAKPVRDSSLIISACISAARESLEKNAQRCAEERLTSSVKAMGRAEESVSDGKVSDADFWLLSAGYDFAFAWLYSAGKVPGPSHTLSQLRQLSHGKPGMYESFSKACNLESASRQACEARLDALGVICDLKESPGAEEEMSSPTSMKVSYELLRRKARSILEARQPADCFCFLGLEVVQSLPAILRARTDRKVKADVVSSLWSGEKRLLADAVIKSLGIGRREDAIRSGLQSLRSQVSALTRGT